MNGISFIISSVSMLKSKKIFESGLSSFILLTYAAQLFFPSDFCSGNMQNGGSMQQDRRSCLFLRLNTAPYVRGAKYTASKKCIASLAMPICPLFKGSKKSTKTPSRFIRPPYFVLYPDSI
jgi:hypothetical protein